MITLILKAKEAVFSNNAGGEKMRITDSGNVGIGTTSPTTLLHVEGSSYSSMATLQPTYHGTKIFVYGPTASTSIDLPAQFPLMGLVIGNVWAVFGKYCGFLAGAAEAREFYISRNSSGTWSSAQFGPSAATGASLASVGGSGVNLEILTTTNSYFTLELTVMIR